MFYVLISFFGRSPGSRYMQNHRISCPKYVSSELMRSKKRQTSPLLIKLCFPSQLYPRQPPPILLTPSSLPDSSEAGGDEAWYHSFLPTTGNALSSVSHELTSVSCFINCLNYSIFKGYLLRHLARPSRGRVYSCSSSRKRDHSKRFSFLVRWISRVLVY